MTAARPWWRRRAKNRDAVAICVLSSACLMAGELVVPVLQEVYVKYIEPALGDPLLLTFRATLVAFAFTTSLGAVLVNLGGWYFLRGLVPRGRFMVGLGVGLTSVSLLNKLSYYTLVYGTPLAFLVPLATSLTGLGILFGLAAYLLMGRFGQVVRKHFSARRRNHRRARASNGNQASRPRSPPGRKPTPASNGSNVGAQASVDGDDDFDTNLY